MVSIKCKLHIGFDSHKVLFINLKCDHLNKAHWAHNLQHPSLTADYAVPCRLRKNIAWQHGRIRLADRGGDYARFFIITTLALFFKSATPSYFHPSLSPKLVHTIWVVSFTVACLTTFLHYWFYLITLMLRYNSQEQRYRRCLMIAIKFGWLLCQLFHLIIVFVVKTYTLGKWNEFWFSQFGLRWFEIRNNCVVRPCNIVLILIYCW